MNKIQDNLRLSYLGAKQIPGLKHHGYGNQKSWIFLIVTVLLLICAGIVWILNIIGIINGPWSGIFVAFFTVLVSIFALLQLFFLGPRNKSAQTTISQTITQSTTNHYVPFKDVILSFDEHRGVLVVYVKNYLRGSTIYLSYGFSRIDLKADLATCVIARRKNTEIPFLWRILGFERLAFVAVFPSLEPGKYTVYTESREYITWVTIYADQMAEVDWQ